MSDYLNYFYWQTDGGWIRVSVRAIIFNRDRSQILIEKMVCNDYSNFLGGGLEVGESLQECIERELKEETNANIKAAEYLFVLNNFIPHHSGTRHSLEHYFEIDLDREDVTPIDNSVEYTWRAIEALGEVDLRPLIVRNIIMEGTYRSASNLISRDIGPRSQSDSLR